MTERKTSGTQESSARRFVQIERVDDLAVFRLMRGKGNALSPAFV